MPDDRRWTLRFGALSGEYFDGPTIGIHEEVEVMPVADYEQAVKFWNDNWSEYKAAMAVDNERLRGALKAARTRLNALYHCGFDSERRRVALEGLREIEAVLAASVNRPTSEEGQ